MSAAPPPVRALVVFSGKADLGWLRLLRQGFRHCFVLLDLGGTWVCVNPLAHRTSVEVWSLDAATDLPAWLRAQDGLRVVETAVRHPPRRASPISIFSCVEAVKRVLGIQERWVLTPGQLYDHLTESGKKSLTLSQNRNMVRTSTPELCPDHPPAPAGREDVGMSQNKT